MPDLKEALPAIVFAIYYADLGDPGVEWTWCYTRWKFWFEPALRQPHDGDCTNQCHSCARCQAEDCVRIAHIIEEGLKEG